MWDLRGSVTSNSTSIYQNKIYNQVLVESSCCKINKWWSEIFKWELVCCRSNREESIFCKNFTSLLVDLFALRITKSNSSQVFTLKLFIALVFLSDHICVLFTFPLYAWYDLSPFNLDLIINLSNHLTNILG